jgi:hypothetical protein
MELAFLLFQQYSISLWGFQYFFDMYLMFLKGFAIDENIIKVGCTEHIKVVTDAIVDKMLEGGWRVGEAERHYRIFEMLVTHTEGCFLFLPLSHSYLFIPFAKIEFGIPLGFGEVVESFPYKRQRVAVFYGKFIKAPIIDAERECSIGLLNK